MEKLFLDLGIKLYMFVSMIVGAMLSASIIKENDGKARLLHSIGGGGLALFAVPALAELSNIKSTQVISFMTVMVTIFGMSVILFIKNNIETIFKKLLKAWTRQ